MSNKHHPHGEPVRWPTPNRRAREARRRELEGALLAEERRHADAHMVEAKKLFAHDDAMNASIERILARRAASTQQ